MKHQFSFGPNESYFCNGVKGVAYSDQGLPQEVLSILTNANMGSPQDVAFAVEQGLYLMRWSAKDGKDYKATGEIPSDSNYARLVRFVNDAKPTRTTFGPGFSYFSISTSGYSWQNIPPALEEDIHSRIKIRQPTCMALGINGAFVAIYNDSTVSFNLHGQYPNAEQTIRNSPNRGGLVYIALSPFRAGLFYAVYGDGGAPFYLPLAWHESVGGTRPIAQEPSVPAATQQPSVPAAQRPSVPAAARTPSPPTVHHHPFAQKPSVPAATQKLSVPAATKKPSVPAAARPPSAPRVHHHTTLEQKLETGQQILDLATGFTALFFAAQNND
ncbi:hypothetical protein K438DRAFT_1926128 [Mycena galopus ATCC 62051]|nr:hypothetical protein K438DRAFT_1926128 [Mycena galopus ATCC 62051]